ncbi:sugar/nucleoside kinase (ribokinase family) [Nocardioides luteus]|uniref:Ribokinase n=1 Tax=Nocardioides luteus TaxID=1844 RepID=A0ABQ5SVL9_9ACTN|nr:PfkB family carbohydrate kinase [Nocardioides luteus]MDR7309458.1 sugar/nucleoside kinase (ribokinase family) [Nocardioides luteus]GGR51345.1 ribokinase [Nocardioides luteus]GLJ67864.1 ribokinase [Nocardioides luteus]
MADVPARPHVVICGPASWNHLIALDELPEPVPHMQFARRAWHTVGGTSAGKALHLSDLDVDVRLWTSVGDDADGARLCEHLREAGVVVETVDSEQTEQHVNLMADGGRISLYVSTPSPPTDDAVRAAAGAVGAADLAVIDLSELGRLVLDAMPEPRTPLWTDLHDYDGTAAFHEPFLRAADVVFMNDDAVEDPWVLMESCLDRGPRLALCTLGAEGAIALEADGTRHEVAATPATVVDTNGAGDAFMAGFLAARLRTTSVGAALDAAVAQARVAVESEHLHPALAQSVSPRFL